MKSKAFDSYVCRRFWVPHPAGAVGGWHGHSTLSTRPVFLLITPTHSYLSATIGSTFIALLVGTYDAPNPTTPKTTQTPTNVTGSAGPTTNSKLPSNLASKNAAGTPTANPIASNFADSPNIISSTFPLLAPSAIRIPISCVRFDTRNEITPNIPAPANTSAITPNNPNSTVLNFGSATESSSRFDIMATSVTGRSLSMPETSLRIVAATLASSSELLTTISSPQNGDWLYGTYIIGPGASCREASRTSPTTPIISRVNLFGGNPNVIRFPIGFSLGKYIRAIASLINVTFGASKLSCAVKTLPRSNGISITPKYPGDTAT